MAIRAREQVVASESPVPRHVGGHVRGMVVVTTDFGGGRPPKLSAEQFEEPREVLENGQPWTPQQIHALIEDCYGVTYHPVPRILLLADNYGSHYAMITQQGTDELGIEFVFISPYSPTLNAIEPLWTDLKRENLPTIKTTSERFSLEAFLRLSHRLGFAVAWIDTFLPDVQILR